MAEKDPRTLGEAASTLTDDQIVTERTLSRRSFLTATGALLAGAVALASGVRLMAQEKSDPDSTKKKTSTKKTKKGSDPDKKKTTKKKTAKKPEKKSDPDSHR